MDGKWKVIEDGAVIELSSYQLKTSGLASTASVPSFAAQKSVESTADIEVRKAELPKELQPASNQVETISVSSPNQSAYAAPQKDEVIASATRESTQKNVAYVEMKKMEFKLGMSSYTVEKMARLQGCESKEGAGLLTDNGPVEVYRLNCPDGSVYLARCELRQCAPMPSY